MRYKCAKCGEVSDGFPQGVIRCPNCAYKVLFKERMPVTKTIIAR
jgi:DNA-directed RNA polymerase subunit RPC12/RpoP